MNRTFDFLIFDFFQIEDVHCIPAVVVVLFIIDVLVDVVDDVLAG